jgi:O-methyltransferase
LAAKIEKKKIKGSFIDCGVCKGGSSLMMAFAASKARPHRKVWLFDSFQGNPQPAEIDGELARQWVKESREKGMNVASLDEVNELFFKKFYFSKGEVIIQKGWFRDTLPLYKTRIGPIAMLRVDADWYESTKCCLENLYDYVSPGGYIIFDDYNFFPGCKSAVDEFIDERSLKVDLIKVDSTAVYFHKA